MEKSQKNTKKNLKIFKRFFKNNKKFQKFQKYKHKKYENLKRTKSTRTFQPTPFHNPSGCNTSVTDKRNQTETLVCIIGIWWLSGYATNKSIFNTPGVAFLF